MKQGLLFCTVCGEFNHFIKIDKVYEYIDEQGEVVSLPYPELHCIKCGSLISVSSEVKDCMIPKHTTGKSLISANEIHELMDKYCVKKEALSFILELGRNCIQKYLTGTIPNEKSSDILLKALNHEDFFIAQYEKNKEKLTDIARKKIEKNLNLIQSICQSRISQAANYILVQSEGLSAQSVQYLLFFTQVIHYSIHKKWAFQQQIFSSIDGPYFRSLNTQYPISSQLPYEAVIKSTHGNLVSDINNDLKETIRLVLNTYGRYNLQTIKSIFDKDKLFFLAVSHSESSQKIDSSAMGRFYQDLQLDSELKINIYIELVLSSTNTTYSKYAQ